MPEIAPPRRRLPWDVLLLVFKQADPSTLAVLGQVSHDFLASTALELYRDVEVTSVKQLEKLFLERKVVQAGRKTKNSSKSSRINPHLSLSQIQTLSIDLTSLTSLPDTLFISSSRIDGANPIPLHHLRISLDYQTQNAASLLYSSLLHLLNPSRCSYKVAGNPALLPWTRLDASNSMCLLLERWDRLDELDLIGIIPYSGVFRSQYLAGLPAPTIDRRRDVRLHLSSLHTDHDAETVIGMLGDRESLFAIHHMQPGSFHLVVETDEQKQKVVRAL